MFGFFGRPILNIELINPGIVDASVRRFGGRYMARTRNASFVEFDKDSQGMPGYSGLTPLTPAVAFISSGGTLKNDDLPKSLDDGFYNYGGVSPTAFEISGPPENLTPANRKTSFTFVRPELVYAFTTLSRSITDADNNTSENDINVPWKLFQTCKYLQISHFYANEIEGDFPDNLSLLLLFLNPNLSAVGKLPAKLKEFVLRSSPMLGPSTNTLIIPCVDLEGFKNGEWSQVGSDLQAGFVDNLGTTLDFSHTKLNRLIIRSSTVSTITLPTATSYESFFVQLLPMSTANARVMFEDVLSKGNNLKLFGFRTVPMGLYARDIINADIPVSLKYLNLTECNIEGGITISDARPNLLRFFIANTPNNVNRNFHTNVDLSGLTNATLITLSGSEVETLVLPINTVITQLNINGNKISRAANPGLVERILTYTSLLTLSLGIGSSTIQGQVSVDGFGPDLDLSTLSSLTTLSAGYCKLESITLPIAPLTNYIDVRGNSDLHTIVNINKPSLQTLYYNDTKLNIDLTVYPNLANLICSQSLQEVIDLRSRFSTGGFTNFALSFNPVLTHLYFAPVATYIFINSNNCPLLSTVEGMENITFAPSTLNPNRGFFMAFCNLLNIPFPLGVNAFLPYDIRLQSNNMSQVTVDETIGSIYVNRAKWSSLDFKVLTIHGTNAAASGIFQAPPGFSLGVSDGTPTSTKEQLYVLVNNYDWSITFN